MQARLMHSAEHETATKFDAIVVGSGATGSWAAKLLSEAGLTVMILDSGQGPDNGDARIHVPYADSQPHGDRQPTQARCYAFSPTTRHLFVDDHDQPYETPTEKPFTWIRTRVIGGRTALWAGVALRMSDRQFSAASLDGFGINWPIRYEELRPHYNLAERFLCVTGLEANLEEIPDGIFQPTDLPSTGRIFQHVIQQRWPNRAVTALRKRDARLPKCTALDALSAANSTRRLTVRANARVSQILTDERGLRADGVIYIDNLTGKEAVVRGKVVLLCASTIETTRIMLTSVSRHHPDGIGNFHGLLGKYLMDHTCIGATGLRSGSCHDTTEAYIPNFRNLGDSKLSFLRGYGIQVFIRPISDQTTECTLGSFGEVLPRPDNRVRLSDRKDKWGIQIPHVTYTYSDNEFEMANDQAAELANILACSGFDIVHRQGPGVPGDSIHEVGTARMGHDPQTSVLNQHNQCWYVPNLFVTDGAAFPSAGFQNPTLTMMAITGRACEYVLDEFKRDSARPFSQK